MSIPEQGDGPDTVTITLKELLEKIAHGNLPDMYLKRLAATLSRLHNKADNSQRAEFERLASDSMDAIAQRIYDALETKLCRLIMILMSLTTSARDLYLRLPIMLMCADTS